MMSGLDDLNQKAILTTDLSRDLNQLISLSKNQVMISLTNEKL